MIIIMEEDYRHLLTNSQFPFSANLYQVFISSVFSSPLSALHLSGRTGLEKNCSKCLGKSYSCVMNFGLLSSLLALPLPGAGFTEPASPLY